MIYLYDGSFDGFLCCVYQHYYFEKAEGIEPMNDRMQEGLLAEMVIQTNEAISSRVYTGLRRRLGQTITDHLYKAFISTMTGKEMQLLQYLELCLQRGTAADRVETDPRIHVIHQASRRVGREIEHFMGWLRFIEIHGILYAIYEPEGDITASLMPHFADRLPREAFIIHDFGRRKAGVCAAGRWEERPFDHDLRRLRDQQEFLREKAWQTYFRHIAIPERENLDLQQQFVPLKRREYMTEFTGEGA